MFTKQAKPTTSFTKKSKPYLGIGKFGIGRFGSAKFGSASGFKKQTKPM